MTDDTQLTMATCEALLADARPDPAGAAVGFAALPSHLVERLPEQDTLFPLFEAFARRLAG